MGQILKKIISLLISDRVKIFFVSKWCNFYKRLRFVLTSRNFSFEKQLFLCRSRSNLAEIAWPLFSRVALEQYLISDLKLWINLKWIRTTQDWSLKKPTIFVGEVFVPNLGVFVKWEIPKIIQNYTPPILTCDSCHHPCF